MKNKEIFRFLAEHVRDVIFIQDMDLKVVFVSPSVKSVFGVSVEEALGKDMRGFMKPESFEKGLADFRKYAAMARHGRDVHIPLMEYEYIRKDGSTFWGELKLAFMHDEEGNPVGIQGILRDVDERKRMQAALQERESLFRTIFDLSPQAIALTEVETGILREVNRTFCELTGFNKQEIVGKTTTELGFYSKEDRERFINEINRSGRVYGLEMDFRAKDGSILNTVMFSKMISLEREQLLLTIFLDVTERKRLEAMLQHAQKMEAVGTLAGGIAHDFNNLLQAILGYSQILLLEKEITDADYEKIKGIEAMARRGGDLTKRLLIYARKMQSRPEPLRLNGNIIQICRVLERTLPKTIEIELRLSDDIGIVSCDPGEFEQIIMNLSVNARDAMPDGGRLLIETKNVFLDEEFCRSHPGAKEGACVLVRVSDTGFGMDDELLSHIFEPFFTTKDTGKGTGLGLAMVYGIVKSHNGYITCTSTPGGGTTFEIYFPVPGAGQVDEKSARPTGDSQASGGRRRGILVVDDEEMVRNSTRAMLEHFGYNVFLADSGETALEFYRTRCSDVDLVILDLGMPGIGGRESMKELRKIDPDVKVIIASGYIHDVAADDLVGAESLEFVEKPFEVEALLSAVRKVLDG